MLDTLEHKEYDMGSDVQSLKEAALLKNNTILAFESQYTKKWTLLNLETNEQLWHLEGVE